VEPRLACDVTQILSWGTAPRTMVQAEEHRPSMITISPELRNVLVFVHIGADPASAILANAHYRLARPHARQQDNRSEQPRHELHVQPQSKPVEPESDRFA